MSTETTERRDRFLMPQASKTEYYSLFSYVVIDEQEGQLEAVNPCWQEGLKRATRYEQAGGSAAG